jgi:molybdopterin molybdotransferase
MDGYAVRAGDVKNVPIELRIVGQVGAGSSYDRSLEAGEAVQINTGAPVPVGADAVVRVEDTELRGPGSHVVVRKSVEPGQFITGRAAYAIAGTVVIESGTVLGPLEIAAAAAAGAAKVTVFVRPTIAILSTGDELVPFDQIPSGAQIRNSNQCLLEALVAAARCESVSLGIAADDRKNLRSSIEEGLKSDVLCLTGGVSMGAFDFVPEILTDLGAVFHIKKMNIKPGRPVHFASTGHGTLIFALPGNPASAFVGFQFLVRPAIAALQGGTVGMPKSLRASLNGTLAATGSRTTFIPVRTQVDDVGRWTVEPLFWGGSGDAMGMSTAGALAVRPPNSPELHAGDPVQAYLLEGS